MELLGDPGDGFFIGAAFKGCGTSFGWGVAVATVLHELPQELADYAVLVGGEVGMSPVRALLANFLVGCLGGFPGFRRRLFWRSWGALWTYSGQKKPRRVDVET